MSTPPNGEARTECVDMILEIMGKPRHRLFEHPHRDDDSRRYIQTAERTLDKILALSAVPADTVNGVDELPIGTVFLDSCKDFAYQIVSNGEQGPEGREIVGVGIEEQYKPTELGYPLTVIHRPVDGC